jgi:hypothetical protein
MKNKMVSLGDTVDSTTQIEQGMKQKIQEGLDTIFSTVDKKIGTVQDTTIQKASNQGFLIVGVALLGLYLIARK